MAIPSPSVFCLWARLCFALVCIISPTVSMRAASDREASELLESIERSLEQDIVKVWYPKAVDFEQGGFLTNLDWQWEILDEQEKGIVTQARHVWTTVQLSKRYPEKEYFKDAALRGALFLQDYFWDKESGGFHWMLNRRGEVMAPLNSGIVKQTYGIAFGIYALAAVHEATGDVESLESAIAAFRWLEKYAHDDEYLGYYETLTNTREPIWNSENRRYPKGQNTTIHLLEAFTELYRIWPDHAVKVRVQELVDLLTNHIIDPRGTLIQFFERDWTPISYENLAVETYNKISFWDHVSFGHDVETAYLLWEAEEVLGGLKDEQTLEIGKRMLDHTLKWGWDETIGGIADGGFYFKGDATCTVVRPQKTWWAQAEMLNTLLMFAHFYPDDPQDYRGKAEEIWNYIQQYLIDPENGGWYENGLDLNPEAKHWNKSHVWKGAYHNSRALLNARHWLE